MRLFKRIRQRIPLLIVLVTVFTLAAGYVFVVAWIQSKLTPYTATDLFVARSADLIIFCWLFWLGSSIGSFLNVVAWRMPRGESVSGRSHCPRCRTMLRSTDNIPVWGWLALGGRCRTCRLPINRRYPIVEALVGISLSLVGIAEIYRWALPHQDAFGSGGPIRAPRITTDILVVLIYHSVAVGCSWAFGLIRWDHKRLPTKLIAFTLAATIIPLIAWPMLMQVTWKSVRPDSWTPDGQYLDAVMRVVTSLAAAALIGRSLARGLCPTADPKSNPLGTDTNKLIDLIFVLAVPCLVLGWQASPGVTLLASLIALIVGFISPKPIDAMAKFSIAMPIAFAIQIAIWRQCHLAWMWPSEDSAPAVLLAFAGMVLCIPIWLNDDGTEPYDFQSSQAVDAPDPDHDDDAEFDAPFSPEIENTGSATETVPTNGNSAAPDLDSGLLPNEFAESESPEDRIADTE